MKIDEALGKYYQEEISRVSVPPRKAAYEPRGSRGSTPALKLLTAALIALCFIPFYVRIAKPSVLARRAAVFCKYHELNTRIPAGLVKISEYSTFQGGKR